MMGMGEPLYNFEAVRDALAVVQDGDGLAISRRRITLSTSGVVPMIDARRRRDRRHAGGLAACGARRIARQARAAESQIPDCGPARGLPKLSGVSNARRITFEYVMLKGVNDSLEDAKALVRLLKGIPAKINLIPFNPWPAASTNARTGIRSKSFPRSCSTPATPRRCARRAAATSSPPAASSRAPPKMLSARERMALRAMAMTD